MSMRLKKAKTTLSKVSGASQDQPGRSARIAACQIRLGTMRIDGFSMAKESRNNGDTTNHRFADRARRIIESFMPSGNLSQLLATSLNSFDTHMTHFMCKKVSEECISSASFCSEPERPEFSQVSVFARTCAISVAFMSVFCNNVFR